MDNVSFVIKGGQKIGIVGESGCGKSTLFKLLFRLFDPSQGRILVDGQDIKKTTFKSLTQTFALVPQTPVLFNDSIKYNLLFGNQNAT